MAPDRATAPTVSTIARIGLEAPVLWATSPLGIGIALVSAKDRRGETPGPFDVGARPTHGIRCLYPDRQQRLVDLHCLAAVQAELRPQPRGRRKGRALRLRLRLVDDQTARVRRPVAVLGLQSGILHPYGRTGAGDEPHTAVRYLRGADHAAADSGAHGGHYRFDFAWTVRRQHHLWLAAA